MVGAVAVHVDLIPREVPPPLLYLVTVHVVILFPVRYLPRAGTPITIFSNTQGPYPRAARSIFSTPSLRVRLKKTVRGGGRK